MRKPTFCICENKNADQLRGNSEADQRLCFRYILVNSTIPLLSKSEISSLAIFCSCTAWIVSDQVGNQNVGFLILNLNLKSLLVKRQIDNPSPGAVTWGKLVPSSHKRGELRHTII